MRQVIGGGRAHRPGADDHVPASMRCMGMGSPAPRRVNDNAIWEPELLARFFLSYQRLRAAIYPRVENAARRVVSYATWWLSVYTRTCD